MPPLEPRLLLFRVHQVPAPVLLPTLFIVFGAERFLFPVAHRFHSICRNSRRDQSVFHRTGTIITKCKVVFSRPTLVAVSFNREADIGMLLQEARVSLDRGLIAGADI